MGDLRSSRRHLAAPRVATRAVSGPISAPSPLAPRPSPLLRVPPRSAWGTLSLPSPLTSDLYPLPTAWALSLFAIAASTPLASALPTQSLFPRSPIAPERTPLETAINAIAAESPAPAHTRSLLIARLRASAACYRGDLTPDEWRTVLETHKLLPPGVNELPANQPQNPRDRFYADAFVWLGEAQTGNANTSRPASLTYSFPPDGTTWGVTCAFNSPPAPSTLGADLTAQFSSLDRGREFIRSGLAAWRRYAAISYTEVADDGMPQDLRIAREPTRGDIRIGGRALGATSSFPLAYNTFPANTGFTGCSGGDMLINSSFFTPAFFGLTSGNFRYFRNTVAHEHGHGLGFRHSVPCDRTKLMEPAINIDITLLTPDEIRGAIGNYGDRFAPNHFPAAARNFGDLTPAVGDRSVIERDLGLNGTVVLINNQPTLQDDYFRFTLSAPRTVTISVTPTGTVQTMALQAFNCEPTGTLTSIDATRAGNLALQLLTPGDVVLAQSSTNPVGSPESITQSLAAGTYVVRVWDIGGAPAVNQIVQTYDLVIDVEGALAPPRAIAGLNKRCQANAPCQFIGDHLSYANQPGATIPTAGYAWDLDGNGSFESNNNSQPSFTYVSNGVFPVTLRVTDSNGLTATDTISVTVFGATTAITAANPATGGTGTTVPVTITGTNFKGVTSASQVTVSGTGVTVTGTPVVNALGTQITGLSFVIAPAATASARDITITNADGLGASGTGVARFTITTSTATGACCNGSTCTTQTAAACASASGTYQGNTTTCSPSPCAAPTGACCSGSTCSITTQAACTGPTTRFVGAGIGCNPTGNFTTPCCQADFSQSAGVTIQDIYDFLTAWFNADPRANLNGATISVQDLFDFVTAWFAGCP